MRGTLADEVHADGRLEGADSLATPEQLADGRAALLAVVLRQLVHVHAYEAVAEREVESAPELQRVEHRLLAVGQPCRDRLAEHLGQLVQPLLAQIAAGD